MSNDKQTELVNLLVVDVLKFFSERMKPISGADMDIDLHSSVATFVGCMFVSKGCVGEISKRALADPKADMAKLTSLVVAEQSTRIMEMLMGEIEHIVKKTGGMSGKSNAKTRG